MFNDLLKLRILLIEILLYGFLDNNEKDSILFIYFLFICLNFIQFVDPDLVVSVACVSLSTILLNTGSHLFVKYHPLIINLLKCNFELFSKDKIPQMDQTRATGRKRIA
jgi:hypothetical protein